MMIAEKPRVMTRFFRKGTGRTASLLPCATFFISIHLNRINNKNAILQIKVNREKNKTTFI
jgi:hypothetical protein